MRGASASAAASDSLQPSVPAQGAVRESRIFAPAWEGGSPSTLITVARTTSSPRATRAARSSSRLGTGRRSGQRIADDRVCARDLFVGRGIAGRQPKAAPRLLEAEAHGEQNMRGIERAGCTCGAARRGDSSEVEREQQVFAPAIRESAGG